MRNLYFYLLVVLLGVGCGRQQEKSVNCCNLFSLGYSCDRNTNIANNTLSGNDIEYNEIIDVSLTNYNKSKNTNWEELKKSKKFKSFILSLNPEYHELIKKVVRRCYCEDACLNNFKDIKNDVETDLGSSTFEDILNDDEFLKIKSIIYPNNVAPLQRIYNNTNIPDNTLSGNDIEYNEIINVSLTNYNKSKNTNWEELKKSKKFKSFILSLNTEHPELIKKVVRRCYCEDACLNNFKDIKDDVETDLGDSTFEGILNDEEFLKIKIILDDNIVINYNKNSDSYVFDSENNDKNEKSYVISYNSYSKKKKIFISNPLNMQGFNDTKDQIFTVIDCNTPQTFELIKRDSNGNWHYNKVQKLSLNSLVDILEKENISNLSQVENFKYITNSTDIESKYQNKKQCMTEKNEKINKILTKDVLFTNQSEDDIKQNREELKLNDWMQENKLNLNYLKMALEFINNNKLVSLKSIHFINNIEYSNPEIIFKLFCFDSEFDLKFTNKSNLFRFNSNYKRDYDINETIEKKNDFNFHNSCSTSRGLFYFDTIRLQFYNMFPSVRDKIKELCRNEDIHSIDMKKYDQNKMLHKARLGLSSTLLSEITNKLLETMITSFKTNILILEDQAKEIIETAVNKSFSSPIFTKKDDNYKSIFINNKDLNNYVLDIIKKINYRLSFCYSLEEIVNNNKNIKFRYLIEKRNSNGLLIGIKNVKSVPIPYVIDQMGMCYDNKNNGPLAIKEKSFKNV